MNKNIIFFILLFTYALHASIIQIDERKSNIYFANGILTTKVEARGHSARLYRAIQIEIYGGLETAYLEWHNNKENKVYVAYNYSFKNNFGKTAGALLDIMESYEQLKSTSLGWSLFDLVIKYAAKKYLKVPSLVLAGSGDGKTLQDFLIENGMPVYLAKFIEGEIGKNGYDTLLQIQRAMLGDLIDIQHTLDLDEQISSYQETIRSGRAAIVVAHSQGNLFTIEAFDQLSPWMQNYFHHISVASPATRFAGVDHWLITFENDPIKNIPGSVGFNTPNHVVYTGRQNGLGQYIVDEPTKFHGFNYYMGEAVTIKGQNYQTNNAKTKISAAVESAIVAHRHAVSQWKKSQDIGCPDTCKARINVAHKYDSALDSEMSDTDVFAFDETAKLYPLDGSYVKGDAGGTGVSEIKDGTVCYELEGTPQKTYGVDANNTIHSGVLEVTLEWERKTSDYDLKILPNQDGTLLGSLHDVSSCQREHFYVQSEDNITAGTYPVSVTALNTPDATYLDTLDLALKLPKVRDVKTISFLHPDAKGVVAKIFIKKKKDNSFIYYHQGTGTTSSSDTNRSGTSRCQPGEPEENSCGCMPCEYKVLSTLSGAYLGPLAGAEVKLYRLEAFAGGPPLREGKTVDGTDLLNAGRFQFPGEFIEALDDNATYILEVQGGTDIDADDNLIADTVPTPNLGTIHAVVPGHAFKTRQPKANILTEIAYQIIKNELWADEVNTTKIIHTLDDIAQRLLRSKVYPSRDEPLSHVDLLDWLPQADRELTVADYDTFIVPVVQKLMHNKPIYADAYNLVYHPEGSVPILKMTMLHVDENVTVGTKIGNVEVLSDGNSSIRNFALSGEDARMFGIDADGTVTAGAPLDFETATQHNLMVQASNASGTGPASLLKIAVVDISDAPEIVPPSSPIRVYESIPIGTAVAQLAIDPGSTPLVAVDLSGDDSAWFAIDLNGTLRVNRTFKPSSEKSTYLLNMTAFNETEVSRTAALVVNVDSEIIAPKPNAFFAHIAEDTAPGTPVGTVSVSAGNTLITEYSLSGTTEFTIDTAGVIRVAEKTTFDYETLRGYSFRVTVQNASGSSETANATVHIGNVPEIAPVLHDINVTVDEQTAAGSAIGNILTSMGDSDIECIELSPLSPFAVSTSGDIVVDGNLSGLEKRLFSLRARARNAFGYSNDANVTLRLTDALHVDDLSVQAYDGTGAGAVIGAVGIIRNGNPVRTVELTGTGSSDFSIDLNGLIRLAPGIALDAERQETYRLRVVVNGTHEAAIDITVLKRIIGSADTPGYASSIVLSGDGTKAYVADWQGGMHIFDTVDPATISIIGSTNPQGFENEVVLSPDGMTACLTSHNGSAEGFLHVIDVSEPASPRQRGSIRLAGYPGSVAISPDGTKAYIAVGSSGLQVVDIGDPTSLSIVASLDLHDSASNVVLSADATKAFVTGIKSLTTVDIHDPTLPSILGSLALPDFARGIALSSDAAKAYVADDASGLLVIDISDPTTPSIIGSVDTPNFAKNVVLSSDGAKAYVADDASGLLVIDISDPTAPSVIGSIDTSGRALDVALSADETKAYVANYSSGLQIIDVRGFDIPDKAPGLLDFSAVIEEDSGVGSIAGRLKVYYGGSSGILSFRLEGEGSEDFAVHPDGVITLAGKLSYDAKNVYMLRAVAVNSAGERPVNVTIRVHAVPEIQPFTGVVNSMAEAGTLVGKLDLWVDDNTTLHDIALTGEGSGNFAANTEGEIYVAPGAQLHHFVTPSYRLEVVASNRFGSSDAAEVHIDVSAIAGQVKFDNPGDIILSADETKAYTANATSLNIVDLNNLSSPVILGSVDIADYPRDILLSSDESRLFVTEGWSGLQIVDVSDATAPFHLGSADMPYWARKVVLSADESKAFVADEYSGIQIVDVSDPAAPSVIGSINMPDAAEDIALSPDGTTAYVADISSGLQVIDITDPALPSLIGSVDTPGDALDIELSSDAMKAYISDGEMGVQIIDVSDPEKPYIISSIDTPDYTLSTTLSSNGTVAFVADNYSGMRIIDISDPSAPSEIGSVSISGGAWRVLLSADVTKVYIVDYDIGLQIVDLTGLLR